MSTKKEDIIGKRYGRLTVLEFVEVRRYDKYYLCRCDCGKEKVVRESNLKNGNTHSCGCYQRERASKESLVGRRFGRLVVIEDAGIVGKRHYFKCKCDCGKEKLIGRNNLVSSVTKSCGCLHTERSTKHGGLHDQEYSVWCGIKRRCYYENDVAYKYYGGRGITVCDRWLNSYENFIADMGRRPSKDHSIDRIDSNGDYEPSNCRWATAKDQVQNRRPFSELAIKAWIKNLESINKHKKHPK